MNAIETLAAQFGSEQREFERTGTAIPGKLSVPAGVRECAIVDLSAAGAGVECADPPALNTSVTLEIEGFGRFEAVTAHHVDGILGLRFVCPAAERQRLAEMLHLFIEEGHAAVKNHRRDQRVAATAAGSFSRPDGAAVPYEILDIGLHGVSLATRERPPIGEAVALGRTRGRVVRHHETGIAIQFLDLGESV